MDNKIKHSDFFKKGEIKKWVLSLKKILKKRDITELDVKQIIN